MLHGSWWELVLFLSFSQEVMWKKMIKETLKSWRTCSFNFGWGNWNHHTVLNNVYFPSLIRDFIKPGKWICWERNCASEVNMLVEDSPSKSKPTLSTHLVTCLHGTSKFYTSIASLCSSARVIMPVECLTQHIESVQKIELIWSIFILIPMTYDDEVCPGSVQPCNVKKTEPFIEEDTR